MTYLKKITKSKSVLYNLYDYSNILISTDCITHLVTDLKADIEASTEANGESVNLQDVFLVTYKNIANPADSSQLNTYQTVVATGLIGSSASTKHFVLHNFATMAWKPDFANIGVFAANEEAEQCQSKLSLPSGLANLENDSNIGENGKYIQVHSQGLECTTKFETLCPVHQVSPIQALLSSNRNSGRLPRHLFWYARIQGLQGLG